MTTAVDPDAVIAIPFREAPRKIIVIRRDNIGDLVCTTPLLNSLRRRFPHAYLAVLVNSYNAPVLDGNRDIDEIFIYKKAKHTNSAFESLAAYFDRARMLWRLHRTQFDLAIVAGTQTLKRSMRLARQINPKAIISFESDRTSRCNKTDVIVRPENSHLLHTVEQMALLIRPLGIVETPPQPRVFAESTRVHELKEALGLNAVKANTILFGIHISARKPSQQWPAERFIALIQQLCGHHKCKILLFWSPGESDNPMHPGDDSKAAEVLRATQNCSISAVPTLDLGSLIAGLSLVDLLICSDGGAMHIAAGLNKPIICLFGDSDPVTWCPWAVPHRLLQPSSRDVRDISVQEVNAAVSVSIRTTLRYDSP